MLELKQAALAEKKTVKEEVPLNRWLYEYIYKTLDPSVYVVEFKQDNIKADKLILQCLCWHNIFH